MPTATNDPHRLLATAERTGRDALFFAVRLLGVPTKSKAAHAPTGREIASQQRASSSRQSGDTVRSHDASNRSMHIAFSSAVHAFKVSNDNLKLVGRRKGASYVKTAVTNVIDDAVILLGGKDIVVQQ